jgi:two-component system, NtrC family, sensor kinase
MGWAVDMSGLLDVSTFTSPEEAVEFIGNILEASTTAPVGFGFVDRDFRIRRMNETLAAVNGLPLEEQLGRTVAEVMPDLWAQVEPVYQHVLDTGEPVVNQGQEGEPTSTPGEVHSWLASYYPVRLHGEIIGRIGRQP